MSRPMLFGAILAGALIQAPGVMAAQVVVNFDDLAGLPTFTAPGVYAGIDFEGPDWGTWDPGLNDGAYPAHSDATVLLTNRVTTGQGTDYFSFGSGVEFVGAWFAGFGGNGPLQWELSYQGNVVATVAEFIMDNTSRFYATGYTGLVDRVGLSNPRGYTVMDDLTYNTSPVPVPAAVWLLGSALGAMGLNRRRSNG